MAVNEQTSKRVAKIAGRVMESIKDAQAINVMKSDGTWESLQVTDLAALAASCLTQATDHKRK